MLAPPWEGSRRLAWRLDEARHAPTWDIGEGAFLYGGRWNPAGTRTVYASLDASTAILEVAVHKGFATLDAVPHIITAFELDENADVHIVEPADVPNPRWLHSGLPSPSQQKFGADLLAAHAFVCIPSAVSPQSWNLLFNPLSARGQYRVVEQQRFGLDTRLHPGS